MRSSTVIQADLDAAFAARTALAKGERVEEVQRGLDRRSLRLSAVTLPQLTTLIDTLEDELRRAIASEQTAAGNPTRTRRPIGLFW